MKIKYFYILLFICFYTQHSFSQDTEELKIATEKIAEKKKRKKKKKKIIPYEPLAPARAAFYSAILPGLGQVYTKKYWKVPLVYGALGTGLYFYLDSEKQYNRFRDIYKHRLAGFTDDEFFEKFDDNQIKIGGLSNEQLIDLQRRYRRDKEVFLLLTVVGYIVNIVDANVTAHLQQYNLSKDLSFEPKIHFDELNAQPNYGLVLNYRF